MTLLGLPWMFWALFFSIALSCLIALAWVSAMDRRDAEARRRQGIPVARSLPLGIAIPTAFRRSK
jgi:hypothetical protein